MLSNRQINALLMSSILCTALMAGRIYMTQNITYIFLGWNLFLAWVPIYFAARLKNHVLNNKFKYWKYAMLYVLWLLFFPNSPYIITDLIHIQGNHNSINWYDSLLIFSFAFTGLSTGILSLHWVQQASSKAFNNIVGWLITVASSLLAGFGVYAGRMLRWNSWDLFTDPLHLLKEALSQVNDHTAQSMTLAFGLFILSSYIVTLHISNSPKHHE